MNTLSKIGIMASLTGSLFLASCSGEYYVADQPVEPVYERPVAPYAGAIWIDGDWGYSSGRYVYHRGYWSRPRSGRSYVRGNWTHTSRGYTYHRGGWHR